MSGLADLITSQQSSSSFTPPGEEEPPPLLERSDDSSSSTAPASLLAAMHGGGIGGGGGGGGVGANNGDTLAPPAPPSEEDLKLEAMFRTMDANSPYSGMTAKELGKLGNTDATVLWDALGRRDPDEVSRVARLTRDINHKFGDYNQMTCLHKAVSYGPLVMPVADCLSMVHSILAHTAVELDALDEDGATPLHLAASSDGCWPAVEVLLDAGADLGIADTDGLTPLHAAAAAGHETVVGLLLGRGADAAAATPEGWTVLHAAASVGVEAILDTILAAVEAGAGAAAAAGSEGGAGEEDEDEEDGPKIEDVEENEAGGSGNGSGSSNNNHNPFDPVDGDGLTPFLVACSFGHLDCARRLLAVGADPTRKDSQGKSATDLADWHSGMDAEVAEVIRESQS